MIQYLKGDIIKSDCDVIIHGCNCFNNMGSGIARSIKETYPDAYKVDVETAVGDKNKLGNFTYVKTKNKYFPDKDVYIVNAYTQYKYGRRLNEVYADYGAIGLAMIRINNFFVDTHDIQFKIGLPKIGAGLAKGDWGIIEQKIESAFQDRTVYVYEFDGNKAETEKHDLEELKKKWKKSIDKDYKN